MNRCRVCRKEDVTLRDDEVGPACRECRDVSGAFWGAMERARLRRERGTPYPCGAPRDRALPTFEGLRHPEVHHLVCVDEGCIEEWRDVADKHQHLVDAYRAGLNREVEAMR